MMDYIAGLVQRGLISPDVANGLVQQIANWKPSGVQPPVLEGGGAGTRLGATTTRQPLLGTSESGYQWIPRQKLDQGQNYNPQIVPDEPIVDRSQAGSSPRYQQEKDWRLRQGENLKDYKKSFRERQKDQE